jgi:hypothetical protein
LKRKALRRKRLKTFWSIDLYKMETMQEEETKESRGGGRETDGGVERGENWGRGGAI